MGDAQLNRLLNDSCAVWGATPGSVDGYGQPAETWAVVASGVACRLQEMTMQDQWRAEQIGPGGTAIAATHKLFLKPAQAITERKRIYHASYYEDTGTTLGAAIGSTSAATFTSSRGGALQVGWILLIDSEQMLITLISGNTVTVTRGVNGTTAATHANGATVSRVLPFDVQFVAKQPGGVAHHREVFLKLVR